MNPVDFTAAYNRAVAKYGEKEAKEIFYGKEETANERAFRLIGNAITRVAKLDKLDNGTELFMKSWLTQAKQIMEKEEKEKKEAKTTEKKYPKLTQEEVESFFDDLINLF